MADFFGAGEADMGGFDPFGDAKYVVLQLQLQLLLFIHTTLFMYVSPVL